MSVIFEEISILCQSVVKPNNDTIINRPNEDYAMYKQLPDSTGWIMALADGAGGYGVFAASWAASLVNNLPDLPLKSVEQIDNWLADWWELFYTESENAIPPNKSFLRNKFYNEGSAATLSAFWLLQENSSDKMKWHYLCLGDSVIFRYNTRTGKMSVPSHLKIPLEWEILKNLLNWSQDKTADVQVSFASGYLDPDDCWILASDALAQWIWINYLYADDNKESKEWLEAASQIDGKLSRIIQEIAASGDVVDFPSTLKTLIQSTGTVDLFTEYLYGLCNKGLLNRDDYSLLILLSNTTLQKLFKLGETNALTELAVFHTKYL